MDASIANDLYRVNLRLTGGPSITDAFGGEQAIVAGVCITYSNSIATAVRLESHQGHELFVDPMDMDDLESWPAWLRGLVDEHRPASRGR